MNRFVKSMVYGNVEGLGAGSLNPTAPLPNSKIAALIHYPDDWDTAAYPTLDDAVYEILACRADNGTLTKAENFVGNERMHVICTCPDCLNLKPHPDTPLELRLTPDQIGDLISQIDTVIKSAVSAVEHVPSALCDTGYDNSNLANFISGYSCVEIICIVQGLLDEITSAQS